MKLRLNILVVLSGVASFFPIRWLVLQLDSGLKLLGKTWGFFRARALLNPHFGCHIHWSVEIKYADNITLLGPVVIGSHCTLGAKEKITLGSGVRLSKGVMLESASLDLNSSLPYSHIAKPIYIEEGVWLGADVIVLGGVRIGKNSVVGAGTVVARDIAANSIVVGKGNRLIEKKSLY